MAARDTAGWRARAERLSSCSRVSAGRQVLDRFIQPSDSFPFRSSSEECYPDGPLRFRFYLLEIESSCGLQRTFCQRAGDRRLHRQCEREGPAQQETRAGPLIHICHRRASEGAGCFEVRAGGEEGLALSRAQRAAAGVAAGHSGDREGEALGDAAVVLARLRLTGSFDGKRDGLLRVAGPRVEQCEAPGVGGGVVRGEGIGGRSI